MKSVFITGSTGFIGSTLGTHLHNLGLSVVGLAHDRKAGLSLPFTLVYADVLDTAELYRVLVDYDVDTVFHLAAQSIVKKSFTDPQSTWRVNALGTVSLLEACRRHRTHSIVVAATDKVYGVGPVPYVEDQPLSGQEPYPASKVAVDVAARSYAHSFGMNIRVVRSANVYGPGDLELSRLVPRSIHRMLIQRRPAILYTGALNMVREFVYITDEIQAFLAVEERGQIGEAYNVYGSGPVAVSEVMEQLRQLCDGQVEYQERDFHEIQVQWMDPKKVTALGYAPSVFLADGLAATVQWFKSLPDAIRST